LIQSNHTSSSEGFIESVPEPLTYRHQEHYLCFDGDFDNDGDDDATTTPTTAATDLLLTVINQVPATLPPPPPLPLSPFNFSYIAVTPPRTTPGPSTDLDTVTSSSSALAIKAVPCDDSGTVILPTTSSERINHIIFIVVIVFVDSQSFN